MSTDTAITSLKEKIDDLNQQAWEVRVTDLPKSFELSQESVKLARSINYSKGLAEGLQSLGFSYVRFFKNDEAAPLLKESLSLFQSLNDHKGQAVVYEYLGIIERNWGNLGTSLDLLLKGNDLIQQTDPPEVEITSCYQIGVTYKHLGNHENALDYLYRTLSLSKKINFTLMEAYATNIIGSIYFDNGNYDQALDCYQQGLIIRRQSNDKWGEAGSLDNIGFTYLKLNDLDKAIDHCKQSLAMCQATGDKRGEANALLHLGEIYEQAGDIKQAAGFSNESLEIRKARGDKRGETEVLLFLADLYKNRKDVEDHQIFEWLSGALKIADEIKAQDLLSKAYYNLHEYYQQKRNFKESLVQLEAHFQIEKELHKNSINQKIANLEISHKAEVVSQRNKELTELNEKVEKANEELKIEAALEKIRSRTNAMHRSESLHEVINEVNDQLHQLGFPFDSTDFLTDYSDKGYNLWVANFPTPIYVPAIDHKIFHLLKEANKRGDIFFTFILTTEEKNIHFKNVFENTIAKNASEELKQYVYTAKGMATSCVVLKNIILSVTNFASIPYTDRENEILKRFAFVFEQSYTRFLDLQKAEAQAREAQIQLALERVRARTMAMHNSNELSEVAALLFEQVKHLGVETYTSGFNIWDKEHKNLISWMSNPTGSFNPPFEMPIHDYEQHSRIYASWKNHESFLEDDLIGEALVKHYKFLRSFPLLDEAFSRSEAAGIKTPGRQVHNNAFFSSGYLLFITPEPCPQYHDIFKRFAKVFEQTYTRFLDLQKAEVQAREAQIEVAVEKVRSRSLAMHKSDELSEVILVVFEKLKELNVVTDGVALINLYTEGTKDVTQWIANPELMTTGQFMLPYFNHPILNIIWEARESGKDFVTYTFGFEEKNSFWNHTFQHRDYKFLSDDLKNMLLESEGYGYIVAFEKYSSILVCTYTKQPFSTSAIEIVKRFARVFEQAYIRFLDLQKAEAQTRESQIELALERVRARTMAMQKSDELREAVLVIYEQLQQLNFESRACNIIIIDKESGSAQYWVSGFSQEIFPESYNVPYLNHPYQDELLKPWKQGDKYVVYGYAGKMKQSFDEIFFTQTDFRKIPEEAKKVMIGLKSVKLSTAFISYGALQSIGAEPLSEEKANILKRFAKVFEQTYTRFLDLQKAEAQARESQIEAALEKVRSRSLAMHNANELGEVVTVIVEKLKDLGVVLDANGVVLCTYFQNSKNVLHWIVSPDYSMAGHYLLPYFDHPILNVAWRSKENGDEYFSRAFSVEEKNSFFEHAFEHSDYRHFPDEFKQWIFQNDQHILSFAWQKNSAILIPSHTGVLPSEEDVAILKRFSKVFEQSYVRFLDLQKAEAQAKEAQIEASLDRIRAKAMAMHLSEEIDEVLEVLFDQFDVLGIVPMSTHLTLINLETNSFTFRETGKGGRKSFGEQRVPIDSMDIWKDAADRWRNMEPLSLNKLHFPKESLPIVWQVFHESFASMPEGHKITPEDYPDGIYHTAGNCKFGYIGMNQVRPATEAEEQIVLKFAIEFGRLYQRYLDLQKAEAQTKEARIEAALERVRSRTMGMQKSEELKDVIQVIYEQFIHLNINIEHTGFVMDYKARDDYDIWIADQLGVPSHVTIPYFDSVYYNRFNEAKKKGEDFFAINLDFEEKNRFYKKIIEYIPGLSDEIKEFLFTVPGLAISTVLLENVCLYIENFSGTPYSDEENKTLMRFGKVFQQTYTRFNDLKLAEAHAVQAEEDLVKLQTEKKRAEDALSELQVTQKQLIQSEKMASLGELTAGIAHEIQNPLNFVNNFSDVNKELLVEMKEEIEKGNTEEVMAIANDIISNEEKINHHGKRADAIVKGMLQHSRSSSGQKEPTDINELADEYLRLAYHGLRAKDKSFNATMKTDFDEAVGKVNVIPQDIGRVFLNLITNAFYVVAEKKKQLANGYEPTVTVTTKKENDKVVVSVKDNGSGIPQKVLDKIFQPFFTTKPTGQGTGLGLSLSYDIVKAHGGELLVETKEGEGTEFIVSLSVN